MHASAACFRTFSPSPVVPFYCSRTETRAGRWCLHTGASTARGDTCVVYYERGMARNHVSVLAAHNDTSLNLFAYYRRPLYMRGDFARAPEEREERVLV